MQKKIAVPQGGSLSSYKQFLSRVINSIKRLEEETQSKQYRALLLRMNKEDAD